jgi:hypothetical protein
MESYPPAPWHMVGDLWLSLDLRPAGVYGAAFVSYGEGSPLTYSELLVARPVREDGLKAVSITDIWVVAPASVAGGRGLWAIPKQLCDFTLESSYRGPVTGTEWSASAERRPIAHARFTDVSRVAVRVPFRGATWQPPIDDHDGPVTAALTGSAKALPCRGHWEFAPDGPLGWLAGARRLASFRQAGFRMSFA